MVLVVKDSVEGTVVRGEQQIEDSGLSVISETEGGTISAHIERSGACSGRIDQESVGRCHGPGEIRIGDIDGKRAGHHLHIHLDRASKTGVVHVLLRSVEQHAIEVCDLSVGFPRQVIRAGIRSPHVGEV
jgi:hypothetical protein